MRYQRILVLGCPGSGKTTFALKLGALWHLPVVHLDKLFWARGWVAKSAYEFRRLLEKALAKDDWIIDGNYDGTLPMRLERSDFVLYFDMPRRICLYGVIKRALTSHGKTRPDMGAGCPERLDWDFIKYVWNYKKIHAVRITNIVISSGKPVVWLRSRRDAKRYLKDIASEEKERVLNDNS